MFINIDKYRIDNFVAGPEKEAERKVNATLTTIYRANSHYRSQKEAYNIRTPLWFVIYAQEQFKVKLEHQQNSK